MKTIKIMSFAVCGMLVLHLSGIAAEGSATKPLVFVLSGQSNMLGRAVFKSGDQELFKLPPNVSFVDEGVKKEAFGHGGGSGETKKLTSTSFGPEVGFANAITQAMPRREIILIKRAKGGTNIAFWTPEKIADGVKADNQGCKTGPWFNLLIHEVRETVGSKEVEWGAVLWMQGCSDSNKETTAAVYCEKQAQLVAAFRKEIGNLQLPFIFGQVNPPLEKYPFADLLRAQQEQYEKQDPLSRRVLTDDLTKLLDNLHYNREGQLELGKRFAEAWLAARQANEAGKKP